MRDQVQHLQQAGIPAACVDSSVAEHLYGKVLHDTLQGRYKLLYVAPERLQNRWFQVFIKKVHISFVVVDEAHCVSQWGHDFRPAYVQIGRFVQTLPQRPLYAAFTATATPRVRKDIVACLGLRQPKVLVGSFDRPNLYFAVARPRNKDRALLDRLVASAGQSGIIYCSTRRAVEHVTRLLQAGGYLAARYHAGLAAKERQETRELFVADKIKIVVATNAFGMGIDKGNVSFVIHYNLPQSLEGYYQEAGRAGRDGAAAYCLLFYDEQDLAICQYLVQHRSSSPKGCQGERGALPGLEGAGGSPVRPASAEADNGQELQEYYGSGGRQCTSAEAGNSRQLQAMWDYCQYPGCLRTYLLRYFGQELEGPCGNCGNCSHQDFSKSLQILLQGFTGLARIQTKIDRLIERLVKG